MSSTRSEYFANTQSSQRIFSKSQELMTEGFSMWNSDFSRYQHPPIGRDEITKSLIGFAAKLDPSPNTTLPPEDVNVLWEEFDKNGQTVDCEFVAESVFKLIDSNKIEFLPNLQNLARKMKRGGKRINKTKFECVFCKNNQESADLIRSHVVRDSAGKVTCPVLRKFQCPICRKTGDEAHTVKYCPEKPVITMRDTELAEHVRVYEKRYACF